VNGAELQWLIPTVTQVGDELLIVKPGETSYQRYRVTAFDPERKPGTLAMSLSYSRTAIRLRLIGSSFRRQKRERHRLAVRRVR
jgi:hypothetical protein